MNEMEVDFFEAEPFDEAIEFFSEETDFELAQPETILNWLILVAAAEKIELRHVYSFFAPIPTCTK